MKENPFFSIVIPSYNRAGFLTKTINSVRKQSFENWECIVVDDGSTDNTSALVEEVSHEDARVKYIFQQNAERGAARNNGANNSKGVYLCFLDSDDYFLENHLQTLYNEIEKQHVKKTLFFTNAFNQLSNGKIEERYCPDLEDYDKFEYILNFTFNPARACLHREIFNDFKFNPDIPGLEDLDLWLRIATKYDIIQIKKRTVLYNLHEETYTLGFTQRYQRELNYFKLIFNQPLLKNKLPTRTTKKLLSMCHYHIAISASEMHKTKEFYNHALKSFLLFPKGYNGKTNKILFVTGLYLFPFVGNIFKSIKNNTKLKG